MSEVIPSLEDVPVSVVIDVTEGLVGLAESIVTLKALEVVLTFPALSVAVVVKLYVPSDSVEVVILHAPLLSAGAVVTNVLALYIETVLFASAVPLIVGVLSLVIPSELDAPVSDAASNTGVPG